MHDETRRIMHDQNIIVICLSATAVRFSFNMLGVKEGGLPYPHNEISNRHVKCQHKDCFKRGVKKKSIKSRNTSHKESFSRASTYVIVIPRNFSCIFVMNNNACYCMRCSSYQLLQCKVLVIAGWLKAS